MIFNDHDKSNNIISMLNVISLQTLEHEERIFQLDEGLLSFSTIV